MFSNLGLPRKQVCVCFWMLEQFSGKYILKRTRKVGVVPSKTWK